MTRQENEKNETGLHQFLGSLLKLFLGFLLILVVFGHLLTKQHWNFEINVIYQTSVNNLSAYHY